MDINMNAPVISTAETIIHAPVEVVWSVQTGINDWPNWNPDIELVRLKGPISPGTEFDWKAKGLPIKSKIREANENHNITWTGKSIGINAIHNWEFVKEGKGTLVRTKESFEGLIASIFKRKMKRMIDDSLKRGLAALKSESERLIAQ